MHNYQGIGAPLRRVEDRRLLTGRGRFVDDRTIEVESGNRYRFESCVIATGSVPARPGAFNLPSPRVMDSTGALKLEDVPARLLVIGGGYIGLEMGYVYAALGSEVSVVEATDGLLPGADRDLVKVLEKRVRETFKNVYLSTKVVELKDTGKAVAVRFDRARMDDTTTTPPPNQEFDFVLISVGRTPNSQGLGLERTQVKIGPRGFVEIDKSCRTADPHIYAIGDIAGEPMLAHKASAEAKVAVEVIAGEPAQFDARAIPAVVFTDPEVAWCGLTETDAQKQGRKVEVAKFPWAAIGRAVAIDRPEGVTKLIIDPATERVLGVGIVGAGAGELIAEATLAVEMAALASDVKLTIHAHPTLSETIMEAAEVFFGQSTHVYRPKKKA